MSPRMVVAHMAHHERSSGRRHKSAPTATPPPTTRGLGVGPRDLATSLYLPHAGLTGSKTPPTSPPPERDLLAPELAIQPSVVPRCPADGPTALLLQAFESAPTTQRRAKGIGFLCQARAVVVVVAAVVVTRHTLLEREWAPTSSEGISRPRNRRGSGRFLFASGRRRSRGVV